MECIVREMNKNKEKIYCTRNCEQDQWGNMKMNKMKWKVLWYESILSRICEWKSSNYLNMKQFIFHEKFCNICHTNKHELMSIRYNKSLSCNIFVSMKYPNLKHGSSCLTTYTCVPSMGKVSMTIDISKTITNMEYICNSRQSQIKLLQ